MVSPRFALDDLAGIRLVDAEPKKSDDQSQVDESRWLTECGGEGGKPGPCPSSMQDNKQPVSKAERLQARQEARRERTLANYQEKHRQHLGDKTLDAWMDGAANIPLGHPERDHWMKLVDNAMLGSGDPTVPTGRAATAWRDVARQAAQRVRSLEGLGPEDKDRHALLAPLRATLQHAQSNAALLASYKSPNRLPPKILARLEAKEGSERQRYGIREHILFQEAKGTCKRGERADLTGCSPATGNGSAEHGAEDTQTQAPSEQRPPRAAPGSQIKSEHREQLRALGMVGTFPPADVPTSAIKMADLSKGKEALKYEALMSWDQKTKSGRVSRQYRYTQEFHDRNAAEKFERVTAVEPHLEAIAKGLVQRMRDTSLPQRDREAAAIANAIRETGLRPTDGADSIKHGHFGISSLQARHVKIKGNEVHLDFIGKEGVRNQTVLRDPANVGFFKEALRGKKGEDFIFAKATSDDAGDLLKELSVASGGPADIKVKDLRTVKATQTARRVVQDFPGPPPPLSGNTKKDAKAIASAIMKMSGEVAKVLNNTATQARDNYIHPEVWKQWQSKLASAR